MQRIQASVTEKLEAIRGCRYFADLSDDILTQFADNTHLFRYASGEFVFMEGAPDEGLYIIRQGSVKLFKSSPQGRELVINVLEEGDSFNEVTVFDQRGNPVSVSALEACELWIVSAHTIRQALTEHPEVARGIILNLSQNLRMLVEMVEELSFYQVTTRLARLLANLPPEQLASDSSQRLTQDDLAARVGTVREVVARSLRKLEVSGAIEASRQKIEILDEGRLMEWAHIPCEKV